jgi:hypothetical protein
VHRAGIALALFCSSCGGRSGLLAEPTADTPDASQPVVALDASVQDAAGVVVPSVDAGRDANGECTSAFSEFAVCTDARQNNLNCCAFSFSWMCDGHAYHAGAPCPPPPTDGGPVTYSGSCSRDAKAAGSFTLTLPSCVCGGANGGVLGQVAAECGIPHP